MSVHGHWRSGAHYLNALLKLNFDHTDHTPRGHAFPGKWVVKPGPKFYINRNFDDISLSIWRLRERFGIRVDSYEEFLTTKYRDMWHDYGKIKVGRYGKPTNASSANGMRQIDMTPVEYWRKHTEAWEKYGHPNVHHVNYDALRTAFQAEMLLIAEYLGSDRKEFENVIERQGWHPL